MTQLPSPEVMMYSFYNTQLTKWMEKHSNIEVESKKLQIKIQEVLVELAETNFYITMFGKMMEDLEVKRPGTKEEYLKTQPKSN